MGLRLFDNVADGGLSKQVDKLPWIPLCAWTLWRVTNCPVARPANSGSAGSEDCPHTVLPHFLAPSSQFPFPLLFTVSSCSFLIHLAVSQSAGTAIVLAQLSFLVWEEIVHNSMLFWLISSSCAASWKNECNYYEGKPIKTIQTESIVGKTIKTGKSLSLILLCSIFSRGTHG